MEEKLNLKLDNYFHRNDVLLGYLKIIQYYYCARKKVAKEENKFIYERITNDIRFIINKHEKEEQGVKDIISTLNKTVQKYNTEELNEIYLEMCDVIDILNDGITNSNDFVIEQQNRKKMAKQNITYIPKTNKELIEADKIANLYNCKVLKKQLKK